MRPADWAVMALALGAVVDYGLWRSRDIWVRRTQVHSDGSGGEKRNHGWRLGGEAAGPAAAIADQSRL